MTGFAAGAPGAVAPGVVAPAAVVPGVVTPGVVVAVVVSAPAVVTVVGAGAEVGPLWGALWAGFRAHADGSSACSRRGWLRLRAASLSKLCPAHAWSHAVLTASALTSASEGAAATGTTFVIVRLANSTWPPVGPM